MADTASERRLSILMVTGAYYPELSGGGLQARAIVQALRDSARFSVLTTSIDRSLPARSVDDGVEIRRVFVDLGKRPSRLTAAFQLIAAFSRAVPQIDVVNVHGFSRKAIILAALSRMFGKPLVLTLQTGVHDEPAAAKALGPAAFWAYRHADLYLSVSPALTRAYLDAGLPSSRVRQVSNAVDIGRFRPATADERTALRADLGLPGDMPVVLFVGFFSRDKRPDVLYAAWHASSQSHPSALVFIGATRASYQEIDPALADTVRRRAAGDGLADRVFFVESTRTIERYFKAADVYVLPSVREGLPIALLEAMATGLPCIASRLPGSTDALIEHGVNGLLVAPDDIEALSCTLTQLVREGDLSRRLGTAARQTIVDRFSIQHTAPVWLSAYREVARSGSAARGGRT